MLSWKVLMCVKTFWRSYKRIKVQGAKGRKGAGGWLWKFFRGRTSWWTVWTCQPSLPIVDICKVCRFAIQINFVEIAFKCCSWIVRSMFSFICKIHTSTYRTDYNRSRGSYLFSHNFGQSLLSKNLTLLRLLFKCGSYLSAALIIVCTVPSQ